MIKDVMKKLMLKLKLYCALICFLSHLLLSAGAGTCKLPSRSLYQMLLRLV